MGRVTIASHLVAARSRSRSCTPDLIADGGFRVSGADFIIGAGFSQWNNCSRRCRGTPLTEVHLSPFKSAAPRYPASQLVS